MLDALATYTGDLWLKRSAEQIAHDLRLQMYAHLQRLSLAYHDRRQKGDLVTRLTGDANSVGTLFSENLGTIAQAILTLIGHARRDGADRSADRPGDGRCRAGARRGDGALPPRGPGRRPQAAQARGRDRLARGRDALGDARRQGLRRRALRGRARLGAQRGTPHPGRLRGEHRGEVLRRRGRPGLRRRGDRPDPRRVPRGERRDQRRRPRRDRAVRPADVPPAVGPRQAVDARVAQHGAHRARRRGARGRRGPRGPPRRLRRRVARRARSSCATSPSATRPTGRSSTACR